MTIITATTHKKAKNTSSINNSNENGSNNSNIAGNLPVVPLSPITQSYILCSNALKSATDKLTEAKKRTHHNDALPPIPVSILRNLLETTKVESHRLKSLTRKMQSVEAATALYWNPDELAKQIAIVDSQLYNEVSVGKHSLLSIATSATPTSMLEATKLKHLLDFQHYLSHSFAHQIIYWIHLVNTFNPSATTSTTAAAVIPPVVNPQHLNKENLLTHLIRVAYLLLHAYYDFSGFAAIMKALTFPEVRRLFHNTTGGNNDNKKQLSIWEHTSSRTKDMFRDLVSIISSENNYQAYYRTLRTKLLEQQLKQQSLQSQQQQQEQAYNGTTAIMIAVPWFEPHLSKIKSIVNSYKAGDNVQSEDRFLSSLLGVSHHNGSSGHFSNNTVVLSAPGAHKLDMEVSILELSQHNSCSSNLSLEEILKLEGDASTDTLLSMLEKKKKSNSKRNSLSPTAVGAKTIHIEGLRAAILTTSNLHSLAPGKQLIHHWLVSRVYLTKEQLINESTEVEPLRLGERPLSPAPSSCSYNDDAATATFDFSRNSTILTTAAARASLSSIHVETAPVAVSNGQSEQTEEEDQLQDQKSREVKRKPNMTTKDRDQELPEFCEQELKPIKRTITCTGTNLDNSSNDDSDDFDDRPNGHNLNYSKPAGLMLSTPDKAKEATNKEDYTTIALVINNNENIQQQDSYNGEGDSEMDTGNEKKETKADSASMGKDDLTEDTDLKEVELKEMVPKDDLKKEEQEAGHKDSEQLQKESQPTSESILSHPSTTVSKPKSSLSPTAPEFIPHQHKSTTTISTISTETSEEIWLGYPTQEEGEEVFIADKASAAVEIETAVETESERWGGYPIPSNETVEQPKEKELDNNETAQIDTDNEANKNIDDEEDEDEVWKGYPGPNSSTDSPRRASSQSETSEEWKGYHATKMEADWQRESALKVQEHEWQGYTLETLDEDELDSSTMMNGEFEKSRQARHEKQNLYETQRRGRRHI